MQGAALLRREVAEALRVTALETGDWAEDDADFEP